MANTLRHGTNGKPGALLRRERRSKPTAWNEYIVADSRNLGRVLGDAPVVDVTVTSPPYWDIKNYEAANQIGYQQSLDEYLDDLVSVFSAVWKCTKPNGSLWIVVKSVKKDGKLHLLPFLLSQRLTGHPEHAWHLQDILIWHKTHTLPWSHRQKLTDNYEYILCLSKSKDFALNLDATRTPDGITSWWVKYPERYHPYGKALSNVWEIAIPTQGSWGNGHFTHACPLPVELVSRIILLSCQPRGLVLDPFAGTGSTPLAASRLGRCWLAVDVNRAYRDMFRKRLEHETAEGKGRPARTAPRLAASNLMLRQIKYGLLIYRRISPGLRLSASDIPLIYIRSGQPQRTARPHWVAGAKAMVVLSDECYRERAADIRAAITEHCGKPPLSKFQIEMQTEVVSRSKFMRLKPFADHRKLYTYTRGAFWKSSGEIGPGGVGGIEAAGKLPVVISDLHVSEEPAY